MKKVFQWIGKWSFMIVLVLSGGIYFAVTEGAQVYAEPLARAEEWLAALGKGQKEGEAKSEGKPEMAAGEMEGAEGMDNFSQAGIGKTEMVPISTNKDTITSGDVTIKEPEVPEPSETPAEIEYVTVEEDYFSDAVFIGDSRTVGLYEYGGLETTAEFYASTGLTVYKLFTSPIVPVEGKKEKQTIEEALQEKEFGKIYLMIGINEMGTGTVESFTEAYREAVTHLQELQPRAIIYIQAIMKVTTERSEQGDYINNEGIEARNQALAGLADNERIFFLDVNPLICDENGGMEASYTYDGVHLKAQYTAIWKDYLKTKAVKGDFYESH